MSDICNVAGLIISYNPDIKRLQANIEALESQVSCILVVDNASTNFSSIVEVAKKIGVEVLLQHENIGIAKALNVGMRFLKDKGYYWVLTLDQDSIIAPNLVSELHMCAESVERCAISCPEINYEGRRLKANKVNSKYQEIDACMTSASLTSIKAWEEVGGFDDSYFIDFVDNEFCMRLKIAGYKIVRNHNTCMSHLLGVPGRLKFGFLSVEYSHHSPFRYYYMTRNNIVFVRKYRKNLNYPKELLKILYNVIMGILVEHNRETFMYIIRGVRDAQIGRMWEYKE